MQRHARCLLVLALALALGVPAHAFGAPSAGTSSDKSAQAAEAQRELQRMQADLAGGMNAYVSVSGQLETTRREIAANTERLRSLEATLASIEGRLGDRAAYMYRTRDIGPLDVLFGAASFQELFQRFDLLSLIAAEDAGLLRQAKRARVEARGLRAGLKAREARLVALRDRSAAERAGLEARLAKQRAYFGALSADVAEMLRQAERAKAAAPSASRGSSNRRSPAPKPSPGLAVATVEGRSGSYYVMADQPRQYRPTGVALDTQASVYSVAENGTGTSSGRPLNDGELTVAHKTLPFNTRIAITRGSRRIIAIVTDRGPFAPPGRDLDLTLRAAQLLGIDGVGMVRYEVVVPTQ